VTASELKRWLKSKGATFTDRKKHTAVQLGEKWTVMPRHAKQEIKAGTLKAILRDLGLRMEE